MYYLISKGTTVSDAELADKLRKGLDQLAQYVSGYDPKQLQAAYETFRSVIGEKPTYDEASLYEGVALDLLERHDEAISRFRYLAHNSDDPHLKEKAKYNEAVSRFRKYTREELDEALKELEGITGPEPSEKDLTDSPVKTLAHAAKATAIAHKFVFWQTIFCGGKTEDPGELAERKKKFKPDAERWLNEVDKITAFLEVVYSKTNQSDSWDPLTRRQLKWAIQNARGNAYLYYAREFYKPLGTESQEEAEICSKLLDQALNSFQECEVLLPAGVETLTNLATTLLATSKHEEARSYCERAITLNPNYEYAYYRLAESWNDENRKDETIKVLIRFPKAPSIPGFRKLYHRYYVEPKPA
jgi:tetratricopeptide (TPR) repeat protein